MRKKHGIAYRPFGGKRITVLEYADEFIRNSVADAFKKSGYKVRKLTRKSNKI